MAMEVDDRSDPPIGGGVIGDSSSSNSSSASMDVEAPDLGSSDDEEEEEGDDEGEEIAKFINQFVKGGGGGGGGKGVKKKGARRVIIDSDDEEREEAMEEEEGDKEEEGEGEDEVKESVRVRMPKKKNKFCPWCSNRLEFYHAVKRDALWKFKCSTCPYMKPIFGKTKFLFYRDNDPDAEEAQIVDSSKANEHRQKTEILCPKCSLKEAYFYQMQTRSADEPMTTFYECCNRECKHSWRD